MNLNWNTVSVVSQPRSIFSTPAISPNVSMVSGTFFGDEDADDAKLESTETFRGSK